MDTSSLPQWAQTIFYIVLAIGTAGAGVFKYLKTTDKEEIKGATSANAASASVISASFIDSKLLRELIEAIREDQEERGRDNKKSHRLLQDLKEALNELNEATMVQTDTTMNLVRFINRDTSKNRVVEVRD